MIGTITHILSKAGYKSMNGPLADERRRLSAAVSPAAYVSYDPRLLAGAGWYGYRISFKGGDRSMLERARYLLGDYYLVREMYDNYADGIYSLGVLLRQRVPHYGIGGGQQQEPDALNFTMPDGGTITLTRNGSPTVVELEYSLDGGATWQIWEEVGNVRSLTLAAGGKMYVRNTSNTSTGFSKSGTDYYNFAMTSDCYASNSVNSLLCKNKDYATYTSHCFRSLFQDAKLKTPPSIDNDVIPTAALLDMFKNSDIITPPTITATSLTGIFNLKGMCMYCSDLEEAPELFIKVLTDSSLYDFCSYSSNIKKIRVHFTDISANNCLYTWVYGVAATGDFYCPAELTIPTGISGIPTGWTRHDI